MQQLFANPFAMYAETQDRIANNRMNEQRNALEMDRFKMQQAEMQAQAEARRRAEQTAALQGRGAQARYGAMFPSNRPAMPAQAPQMAPQGQAQPMPPMQQGGAPIEPMQPEIDQATGKPIDRLVVQDQQRQRFVQSEGIKREMDFYAQEGRWDLVSQLAPMFEQAVDAERKAATAEEQQGYDLNSKTYEGIAQWAVLAMPQIAQIPNAPGWDRQVMSMVQDAAQRLNRMGLDGNLLLQEAQIQPGDTPQSIAAELDQLISQMGGADAIKSRFNTRTVDAGNRQLTVTDAGSLVRNDAVGVSPNTVANNRTSIATAGISAATQKRGQDISADTARRGQDMTAATAARASGAPPTVVSIREVKP